VMMFERLDLGSILPSGDALSQRRDWPWKAGEPLTLMPYEIEVE
jgi:hypothetical protein